MVKPFYGPLAGTFRRECSAHRQRGWREGEAGFTLFTSAVTVNCAHGCIYIVPGLHCFVEHGPETSRGRWENWDVSQSFLFISAFSKLRIHQMALLLLLLSTYYISRTMWSPDLAYVQNGNNSSIFFMGMPWWHSERMLIKCLSQWLAQSTHWLLSLKLNGRFRAL